MYIIFIVLFVILIFIKAKENFVVRNVYPYKSNIPHNQDILRYIKYDTVDSIGLEISFKEFNTLLNKITYKFKNKNIDNINKIILYDINSNYLRYKLNIKYGDSLFQINHITIIKNENNNLIYNLEIYRENKYHFFIIQININNFLLKSINIIGIALNENLNNKYSNKNNIKDLFTQNNVNKIINNKLDSYIKYQNENSYQCFGKQTITKNHCISKDEEGKGIWDNTCKKI